MQQNKKIGFDKKDFVNLFLLVMANRNNPLIEREGLESELLELLHEDRYNVFTKTLFPNREFDGLDIDTVLETQANLMKTIELNETEILVTADSKYVKNVINVFPVEYVEAMDMLTGEYLDDMEFESEKNNSLR